MLPFIISLLQCTFSWGEGCHHQKHFSHSGRCWHMPTQSLAHTPSDNLQDAFWDSWVCQSNQLHDQMESIASRKKGSRHTSSKEQVQQVNAFSSWQTWVCWYISTLPASIWGVRGQCWDSYQIKSQIGLVNQPSCQNTQRKIPWTLHAWNGRLSQRCSCTVKEMKMIF